MIVIPMAGVSKRFLDAGYDLPKYMLKAGRQTLFDHSIRSFSNYFNNEKFLFIVRDIFQTPKFIEKRIEFLGIKNYEIIVLGKETRGQAETVAIGLNKIGVSSELTIFNIDTIRINFNYPSFKCDVDGYLEVFNGVGDGWSFVQPKSEDTIDVSKTAEKIRISNLCSTGLYYFRNTTLFLDAFEVAVSNNDKDSGEFYVAPLYNQLINKGLNIKYDLIKKNTVIFSGVPDEYEAFKLSFD